VPHGAVIVRVRGRHGRLILSENGVRDHRTRKNDAERDGQDCSPHDLPPDHH
jgi:hypothetical protein